MKAETLVRNAYLQIGKADAEQPITASMFDAAVFALNNIIASKDHLGLGYTEVENASDDITTPSWSWRWLTYQLALDLAPQFGQLESYSAIDRMCNQAYKTVLLATQRIQPPQLSSNVPLGSGNKRSTYTNNFYTESDDGLLTETNQIIIGEDS